VADLEEERRHLRAGEPCPLCGGRDHPWAEGRPPAPDKAREALTAAQADLADTEKRLQNLIARHSRVASRLEETATQLEDLAAGQREIDAALTAIDLPGSKGEVAPLTAAEHHQRMVELRKALTEGRDLVAAAEGLEKEVSAHRAELEQARSELAAGENRGRSARFEKEAAAREAARLDKELETLEAVLQKVGRRLLAELGPYGIDALPEAGAGILLESLAQRMKDYAGQQEAVERWQTTISTQTHAAQLKAQELQQTAELLSQAQARLETLTQTYDQLNRERRGLFGEKDPDDEEVRLAEAVTQAEGQQQTAARERATLAEEVAAAAARTQSLAEQGDRLKSDLGGYQAEFDAALTAAGFRDEADLANAYLGAAEIDPLSARREALAKTAATLTARRSDRQEALATARAQQLTTATRENLRADIEALAAERQALQARAGAISEQRAQLARAKARQAEIMKRCERQSAVYERWGRLHDLIGSADGKKFRVFAQGLTFEQVVAYANQELQKMSDRYIMIRDKERPLNLLMADDYQGGVLRATDNLSGGESFLVSLALALGLAKMASRNVRLDSLFLDEGFGTLDEETLEIALDTLGGLRQEGKLIGVISHVATLKERIPTQIKVVPGNNGRSTLAGPGCRGGGDTSQKE
jgi:exonuclease SbcC